MKTYMITVKFVGDETNRNFPPLEVVSDTVIDILTTTDNDAYGISEIKIVRAEVVDNFD